MLGGMKYNFLVRRKMCLPKYLIGTAKLVILKTRKNKGLQLSIVEYDFMFQCLVNG